MVCWAGGVSIGRGGRAGGEGRRVVPVVADGGFSGGAVGVVCGVVGVGCGVCCLGGPPPKIVVWRSVATAPPKMSSGRVRAAAAIAKAMAPVRSPSLRRRRRTDPRVVSAVGVSAAPLRIRGRSPSGAFGPAGEAARLDARTRETCSAGRRRSSLTIETITGVSAAANAVPAAQSRDVINAAVADARLAMVSV